MKSLARLLAKLDGEWAAEMTLAVLVMRFPVMFAVFLLPCPG